MKNKTTENSHKEIISNYQLYGTHEPIESLIDYFEIPLSFDIDELEGDIRITDDYQKEAIEILFFFYDYSPKYYNYYLKIAALTPESLNKLNEKIKASKKEGK